MPAVSAETAHDAAGNQLRDFNDNYQLSYDEAGRLARVGWNDEPDGEASHSYYDLSGQRIFKTQTQYGSSGLNSNTPGVFYQYDQNGNLLWQQTVGSLGSTFLENEASTHYYWLPTEQGDILIGFDQGANSYAVYTDHLNTPRLVTKIENPQNPVPDTDTSNDLPQVISGDQPEGVSPKAMPVWQWDYSAFGAELANGYEAKPTTIANNFKPDLWAGVGLPEVGGADTGRPNQESWRVQANLIHPVSLNIRYPGQYYDAEAGLVQNWWRTYEPRIGRYVSADPIGLNGGWNRFTYAGQDGVNGFDPDGLQFLNLTTVAGARRNTTLDDAVRAGAWTRTVTMPMATVGLMPSVVGLIGSAAAPLVCTGSETVTVSRWGREGLEAGDWVMKGGVNRWNYARSFKWERTPWNQPAPYSTGTSYQVPSSSLATPSGWETFKAIFGQRIFLP